LNQQNGVKMNHKYRHLFWLFALLTAFSFDQFFWGGLVGINILLFVMAALLGGLIPIWLGRNSIPWTSYLLLLPIVGFALMTFFRAEPLTSVMNVLITMGALVLLATTLRNGDWFRFNLQEHLVNTLKFLLNCFAGGILFFVNVKNKGSNDLSGETVEKDSQPGTETNTDEKKPRERKFLPYLRGVLIAVPILIILTLFLTSADPVFARRVQSLYSWFDIENIGEYIFRSIYIFIIAYLLLSAFYFGLVESRKIGKKVPSKPIVKPFLGFIESWIILGAVNLLFLSFVILQFTYLFGGKANINVEGFTYSEYAVRGYFELVAVVIMTLILFYVMTLITKRRTNAQRWVFSGLGLLLVGLTGIILASAYKRLSLYEAVYGFTRLRTMTHISIIWVGVLLLAVIILEIIRKTDRLAIILICIVFGFGLTANLVNIDGFIVQQNVDRAINVTEYNSDESLDAGYLYTLSYDSIPPLISRFTDPTTPETIRDEIGGVLACRLATIDTLEDRPWHSFHYSQSRAVDLLEAYKNELEEYPVHEMQGWVVEVNGETRPCDGYWSDEWLPD
jgi:hypothetical protein